MSDRASLKITQIVVEAGEGEYCAVSLPASHMNILLGFIIDLSDGPVKLVRLPGVKMVPLSELDPAA